MCISERNELSHWILVWPLFKSNFLALKDVLWSPLQGCCFVPVAQELRRGDEKKASSYMNPREIFFDQWRPFPRWDSDPESLLRWEEEKRRVRGEFYGLGKGSLQRSWSQKRLSWETRFYSYEIFFPAKYLKGHIVISIRMFLTT